MRRTKDWKEWGSFSWCRGWEWVDTERVSAIFTVILAIATWALYRATRNLVRGAEETAERQLRAYVLVSSAKVTNLTNLVEGNGIPEAIVVIKNSGQTPAYDLHNVTGFTADSYPPRPTIKLTISDKDSIVQTTMPLGPGDTTASNTLGKILTDPQKASLADGTGVVYVYGTIRYRDVFGKHRCTKYRLMIGGPVGVRGGQLTACEEGNEAN
jgi:hypothetical protein